MNPRSTIAVAAAAAAAALSLAGCFHVPTKIYEAPLLLIPAHKHALLSAVEEAVAEQKWTLVSKDTRAGTIVALTPEQYGEGVTTRERWTFQVEDGELTVAMQLEMSWGGTWRAGRLVCEGYEYLRERAELAKVWTHAMPAEAPPPIPEPRLAMLR